jgi:hypothetical protein
LGGGLGPFTQYADEDGDGTGNNNANGDYSGANAEEFFIQPGPDQIILVNRAIIFIEDDGGFRADHYGVLGAALANGIMVQLQTKTGGVITDYTDGFPIKANADWGRLSYDVSFESFGAGTNYVTCRWTFGKTGLPLLLQRETKLVFKLNDNFTGIDQQTFNLQGVRIR